MRRSKPSSNLSPPEEHLTESIDQWAGVEFRKSSFSGGQNGACVELAWRKSSFSGGENGSCVEIAQADDLFGVRDSKNNTCPVLEFGAVRQVSDVASSGFGFVEHEPTTEDPRTRGPLPNP